MNQKVLDSTYREAAKINRQTWKALMEIKEESDGSRSGKLMLGLLCN